MRHGHCHRSAVAASAGCVCVGLLLWLAAAERAPEGALHCTLRRIRVLPVLLSQQRIKRSCSRILGGMGGFQMIFSPRKFNDPRMTRGTINLQTIGLSRADVEKGWGLTAWSKPTRQSQRQTGHGDNIQHFTCTGHHLRYKHKLTHKSQLTISPTISFGA